MWWAKGTCVLLFSLHLSEGTATPVRSQRQLLQGGQQPLDTLSPPLVPLPVLQQIVSDEQPAVSSALTTLGPPVLDAAITTLGQTIGNAPLPNAAQQQQLQQPQQQPQQQQPPPQLPQLPQLQQQQQPPQVQQAQQQAAAQQPAAAQPQAQQPLQQQAALQPGAAAALANSAAAQRYASSQGTPAQQQALQQQQRGAQQAQGGQSPESTQGTSGHTSFNSLLKPDVVSWLAQVPTPGTQGSGLVSPSGAPQAGPAPGAQLGGCVAAGITLAAGACMPFVAPFAARTSSLGKLSETDFQQAVALGPTPADQCCMDAGAFVRGGCACDAQMVAYGPHIGLTPAAITLVARAAVMACPRYHIVNPCR